MSELGVTNAHSGTHTGHAQPINSAPYRQTHKMEAELEHQLEKVQQLGIIEESNSCWYPPVTMVRKQNNKW